MSDDPKRPWYTQLPAKMAAVVVFLVAITTLVGNVMELVDKRRAAASSTPTATSRAETKTKPVVASAPQSDRLRLQLERIAVENDGSIATTDWRFSVEANGEPLFVFQQDEMDDTPGRNVVLTRDTQTTMRLAAGQRATLAIKGWRGSRFRLPGTQPDVTGEGIIAGGRTVAPIRVGAGNIEAGAFVFYFSVARED